MNLPQPPEGVLDPKIPWSRINPNSRLWIILKARLTGRPTEGENYSSYVNISEADADRLIANMKKDPRGYPSLDQESGTPVQWMERQQKYQEWLVEAYLENPFREQTNKKIEEAAIEARINEIQEQRRENKKPIAPEPVVTTQEEEQKVLDSEQEAIEEETTKITTELDSVEEPEKQDAEESKDPEQDKLNSDIESISDSLANIKGALQNQIADLGSIERDNTKSVSFLEGIKQLFDAQTDIIRREIDIAEKKASEKRLEQTDVVSGNAASTSTTADNKAEGIIQGIDGPVITVKTTTGEFRQGEKISQGGGGGGLFDMLKGIAGKFISKGKGGGGAAGGSPIKMSSGGFLNTPYPASAGGTFAPGVYGKPTRGNLGPGQAVIPLNRNIGKKMFGKTSTATDKLQQPLADVMAQPLKAIGLSILSITGNFLKVLGPLAGFFAPYVSGLVKNFASVLGVPATLVMSLLGGPAYAAMEDQDKQQNVFAKLWSDLMKAFGFNIGGDDKNNKNKTQQKKGKVIQGGDADFWSLAAVASLEGATPQGEADVAQAVYNRVASGAYSVKTIKDAILSPGQFQPVTYDGADLDKWKAIKDRESAIAAVATHKGKGIETATKYVDEGAANITNPQLQKSASEFVGGRTDFAVPSAANKYPGGFGYVERDGHLFGWYVGPGAIAYGKTNPGPASMPNFNISAESGAQVSSVNNSLGGVTDWSIVDGPDSGYKVNDNLTMHGKEVYLQHQNGFTILPVENNEYSLTKDPIETLARWKEILSSSGSNQKKYEQGGRFKTNFSGRGSKGLARGTRATAGFTGMGKAGFDAIMGGAKYIESLKAQILGRGAYSAPTATGAARYSGASGSLGGKQVPGGIVKSIVPGGARRLGFLEPQSKVSGEMFDKGKILADKLLRGEYANSALGKRLSNEMARGYVSKALTPAASITRLLGKGLGILNAPVIGDMIFPEGTSQYDQPSGPNAYYNDPRYKGVKPSSVATSNKPPSQTTVVVTSKPQQVTQVVVPTSSSGGSTIVVQSTPPIHKQLERMTEKNFT
jgi:hypothetical protein